MKIIQTHFSGNLNLGLYGYVTDSYGLISRAVKPVLFKKLEKLFDVPLVQTSIGGTDLIGVFVAGNEKSLVVPSVITDDETAMLDDNNIPYAVSDSMITALGNVVLTDETHTMVSPECDDNLITFFEKAFGTTVMTGTIAGLGTLGSMGLINEKRLLVPPVINPQENEIMGTFFKKHIVHGMLMNTPYLSAGVLFNSHGAVVSKAVGGTELFALHEFFEG